MNEGWADRQRLRQVLSSSSLASPAHPHHCHARDRLGHGRGRRMRHVRPPTVPGRSSVGLVRPSIGPHGAFPVVNEGHESCGRFRESRATATGAGARAGETRKRWTRGRSGRTLRSLLTEIDPCPMSGEADTEFGPILPTMIQIIFCRRDAKSAIVDLHCPARFVSRLLAALPRPVRSS